MKKSSVFEWLINPFTRIAGFQALGLGLIFLLLLGILGSLSGVAFDGVLDVHFIKLSLTQSFEFLAIDVLCLVVVMWITGLIVSKSVRVIDILGTMALAKAPLVLLAFAGLLVTSPEASEIIKNPTVIFQYTSFVAFLILTIPLLIWNITLMFNAFKTSCGLSGTKLTVSFIIALLASELLAKIVLYKIM